MSEKSPEQLDFPANWDELMAPPDEVLPEVAGGAPEPSAPGILTLMASSWADLAALFAVGAAELVAVAFAGYRISVTALPWVLAAAATWWIAAAAALVVVRRGTPGMLMAGVAFDREVGRRRLPAILMVGAFLAVTLGLPAIVGRRLSPLRLAAGSPLVLLDHALAGDEEGLAG